MRNRCRPGMLKLRGLATGVAGALHRPAHTGQTMVLFALMAVVLFGFLGLAADAGYLISERRGVQNAADAAALVAARLRSRGATEEAATAAALAYVADNEYDGATVDIEYNDYRVTVSVRQEVPPFFIGVLYTGDWVTEATATATWTPIQTPYALIALGHDPAPGITFSGLNAPQGGITIQCDPPMQNCGSIGSNSDVTFNGNPSGYIGGNISAVGALDSVPSSFQYGGIAAGGQGDILDPFAGTPKPECKDKGKITIDDQGRWHLSPGLYTDFQASAPTPTPTPGDGGGKGGGKGSGNGGGSGGSGAPNPKEVIFEGPGIFCFSGEKASLSVENNIPHRSNGGVLLYFTDGATIDFQSGDSSDLIVSSADATGDSLGNSNWNQMAIWVDNTPVSECKGQGDKNTVRLEGKGELDIQGAIYAPNSQIALKGNSNSATVGGPVVGHCVDIGGSVIFTITVPEELQTNQGQVYLIE
uniref:Putative Flp pilus-assembly TadG-like N-terminal domain-containing protein n=2 Tax=Thermorudis TaxID=1649508 RepID=A0A831TC92_9BACT